MKTQRGMAVLIIALRTGRVLTPPFPSNIEEAVKALTERLKTQNKGKS